ncbi:MAG: hypothetical protein ACPL6D_13450 [Thermodesulfobacteriota bacterium]
MKKSRQMRRGFNSLFQNEIHFFELKLNKMRPLKKSSKDWGGRVPKFNLNTFSEVSRFYLDKFLKNIIFKNKG